MSDLECLNGAGWALLRPAQRTQILHQIRTLQELLALVELVAVQAKSNISPTAQDQKRRRHP